MTRVRFCTAVANFDNVKKEVQLMKHRYGAQWIDYWSTNRAGNGHD